MFTVEHLLEGRSKPVSISGDKAVLEATSLMAEHDYGQLPVVDAEEKPIGIITSDSILRAARNFGIALNHLKVNEAAEKPEIIRLDGDVFELLDDVRKSYAVLVTDAEGRLMGIVTHYDTAAYFRRRAEDMMVVQDIETTLKQLIATLYHGEAGEEAELNAAISEAANEARRYRKKYQIALKSVLQHLGHSLTDIPEEIIDNSFKSFGVRDEQKNLNALTLEEMTSILVRHKRCPTVGLKKDLQGVRQLLKGVRDTRNALAHFRREITAEEREQLRFCSQWLSRISAELQPRNQHPKPINLQKVEGVEAPPTDETSRADDSMYAELATVLLTVSGGEIWLTFEQIEGIIKYSLPESARVHRAWWTNDPSHSHARHWLNVGWRVKNLSEGGVTFSRIKERGEAYNLFFSQLANSLKAKKGISPPDLEPQGRSYFRCAILRGSTKRQLPVYASFARNGKLRIEIYLGLGDRFLNKRGWQMLFQRRDEIERNMGETLSWERLDDKAASRVALYNTGPIGASPDPSFIPWATEAVSKMVEAFREPVRTVLDIIHEDEGTRPSAENLAQ
jgi:CBS domain-containing protein